MNRDPETYAIIGVAMEVHRALGHGFLEAVYPEALAVEFATRQISFRRERPLVITYKGEILKCAYMAGFVCYEAILVEPKAMDRVGNPENAQVINYLNATKLPKALLVNCGSQPSNMSVWF